MVTILIICTMVPSGSLWQTFYRVELLILEADEEVPVWYK